MTRFLFLLLFFLSFTNLYSQLDREHWFPPMVDRATDPTNNSLKNYQSIYLSTGETTPFQVDIYFDNVVIASLTISKNNPQRYIIPSSERNRIIISPGWHNNPATGLFQPVKMGFYLKGEKPFFASLRFSITNHGEIQTSKGTAGLGMEFRTVMAPLSAVTGRNNFMNSVMATENNTTVTISEFKPDVIFIDEITRTEITFKLDKGESYIIEGADSYFENWSGYIGTKIVSDKPVVIANGNFNGQYTTTSGNADILMDQSVPINKLGKTFVMVKGNGENGYDYFGNQVTMEKAMIVATKDNTKIYLNGNTIPVTTLKAGEYYATPPGSYINQGLDHFNMYIEASEDVYVYQLLAGLGDNSDATGGFNYIPPLSCYLPKKIDEIGLINENEYTSNNVPYSLTVSTKLNIITEKGATIDVKRNGTSLTISPANGPYSVSGNSNWVTYSIPDISGNISITSTHAVTAGITAGNDAVGYGGFFAGFSSIPMIVKIEGECLPDDVKLAVIEGYDHYEWLIKDINGNYRPAPINPKYPSLSNHFYYPTQAGIYAVRIQTGSCSMIQTDDYKFYNCTTYTNVNYDICSSIVLTPKLYLSSQSVNTSSVRLENLPSKGIAVVNPNGTISYTANPNITGTDTFKYSFCGSGVIPDCETIQATIRIHQTEKYDAILTGCSTNGLSTYNLTTANVTPNTNVIKTYYKDAALTQQIPANQISNYISADGFVYVKLVNTFGCPTTTALIELTSIPYFVIQKELYKAPCDEDFDGIKEVNLSDYIQDFTTDTGVTITYFKTLADANGHTNPISGTVTINKTGTFYLKFQKNGYCDSVGELNISIKIPKKSDTLKDKFICPNSVTELDAGSGFDSYLWSTGEITQTIKNIGIGEYWVELTFNGCPYKQNISVKNVALPVINFIEINGTTVTINVSGANPPYQYSLDGIHYQSSNVFTNVPYGQNTVYVISKDNCYPVTQEFTIIQLLNVITPNSDGKNDFLDYSDLLRKEDPLLQIFDRFGKMVFKGEKNNRFIWDGKSTGKNMATGTYWCIIEWKDPGSSTITKYNGWILLKNRD